MTNVQQHGEPKDPMRLMSFTYFITSIGSGILLSNNWPRLGKPEWRGTSILLSVVIPIGSVAIGIGLFVALLSTDAGWLGFIPLFAAFGANIGYVWALARMQNPAYKKFKNDGPEAMLAHEYDVQGALIFGLILVVVGMLLGGVLGFLNR